MADKYFHGAEGAGTSSVTWQALRCLYPRYLTEINGRALSIAMQAQSIYYVWEVYDGIGLCLLAEWISTDKQPNYQKLLSASAFVPYIS